MAKKGRPRKAKAQAKNPVEDNKKIALQKHWDYFQSECEEYETHLDLICKRTCDNVRKIYVDKLNSLPENIRNMTMLEYMEFQKNIESQEKIADDYRSEFEKTKLMSEKKRTLKKNKIERKRSISVCGSNTSMVLSHSALNRVLSEPCLSTPLSKRSVAPTFAVTPKFNPKVPIVKTHMRRPRVGEILMSLSGSPLQNTVGDILDKPGVSVSLGGGKVFQITEDTEMAKLENEFVKTVDHCTRQTLANVKRKLDRILQCNVIDK